MALAFSFVMLCLYQSISFQLCKMCFGHWQHLSAVLNGYNYAVHVALHQTIELYIFTKPRLFINKYAKICCFYSFHYFLSYYYKSTQMMESLRMSQYTELGRRSIRVTAQTAVVCILMLPSLTLHYHGLFLTR